MYLKQTYKQFITGIILCLISFAVFAQDEGIKINGVISGESGAPVPDVSISIEGVLANPAISDESGSFELTVPNLGVWLLVAPIGDFKSKRIHLNQREELNIRLVPLDRSSMYDEVLTLKGSQVRREISGSYENIDLEQTGDAPVQTISQYLGGRALGLLVYNHSGMPGDGTYSYMRGIRSLYTNNQPLIIVDGLPVEKKGIFSSIIEGYNLDPMISIDPQDITDLTIQRDAGAASDFGLKSSNGVILIETLKPTETRTMFDFSFRSGYSLSPDKIPVLDNNQYRTLAQEILITSPIQEEEYRDQFPGLFADPLTNDPYRYIHNTDWQNEVFRNAALFDFGMSIRGGDAISKYGLSVGYQNYDGIVKNTNYNRINLRFVGSFNIFTWLELNISTSLSNAQSALHEMGIASSTSPLTSGLFKSPVMAPYRFDSEGQQLSFLDDVDAFGVSNPTAVITGTDANSRNFKFMGTFNIVGHITKKIKWNSMLGLNFGNIKENIFLPDEGMESYRFEEGYNEVRQKTAYMKSIYFDNYFNYDTRFRMNHHFTARLGLRINTNDSEQDYGIGNNTPSDEYTSLRFAQPIYAEIGGDIGHWNWMSIYGQAGYDYKNKYYLSLKMSMDGSSRTGKDAATALKVSGTPFGLFYSVNGAWRISAEPFFRNVDFLDELKLRMSYGLSGNDDIGNYSSRRYYTQVKYRETTGMILGTKPVTDLKFESVQMADVGLDISMINERLNLSFDLFSSKTLDMLIYERQEDYIGYAYLPTNGGSLKNTGFEAGLYGRIISAGDFKLDAGINISRYKNEVLSIKGGSLITEIIGGELISKPGHPVNSFYGYVADGVFSTQEEANEAGLVNEVGSPYMAGDVVFRDISGPDGIPDNVINEFDKGIIGSPNPDFYGGFNLRTTYRRWSLSTLFQFVVGHDVYNYMRYQLEKMSNLDNQSTSVLNRWQYDGQMTDIPRSSWEDPQGNNAFSTRWLEEGSFMRVKDITLAYTVKNDFLFFDNARFFASVINPFIMTRYLGYDPEFSYSSEQSLLGIDYGLSPQSTTFMMGVKLGL